MVLKDGNVLYANELVQSFGRDITISTYNFVRNGYTFTNTSPVGVDKFTDSNGVNNTVDTGTSTALFTINYYSLTVSGPDGGNHTETALPLDTTQINAPDALGYRINATDNCYLISVTKDALCTATRAVLKTSAGATISTASFVGDLATFAAAQSLTVGTDYRVELDNSGAGYNNRYKNFFSVTAGTNISYVASSANGGDNINKSYNIASMITQDVLYVTNKTVETNEIISVASAPKSILVYGHKSTPTNTSITISISDDGGATWEITGQAFDTYIDTTALAGTSLALKFTLATTNTSVTPTISGYSVAVTDY